MKKVLLALLLTFILTGLLGCKTSRATLKTDMKQELRQTSVTDSSRSEQKATADKISEALATSEQKNVVIEFEEWEYYPAANDTTTGGNYAQKDGNFMRTSEDADKQPNAGSVKKRRKGTITINADKQTQTKEQETTASEETKVAASTKTNTNIKTKEKTKSTETTGKSKWYVWLILGLVFAAVLIWVGRDIARKAERG